MVLARLTALASSTCFVKQTWGRKGLCESRGAQRDDTVVLRGALVLPERVEVEREGWEDFGGKPWSACEA